MHLSSSVCATKSKLSTFFCFVVEEPLVLSKSSRSFASKLNFEVDPKVCSFSVETLHRTCQSDPGGHWIFHLTYCPDFRLSHLLLLQVKDLS